MSSQVEPQRLLLPKAGPRHTHYLFRFPAKFHPPVVQTLVERYVKPGDLLLDCFCGSGTSLVEAAISGRRSVGTDIDPVATMVSFAKTRTYEPSSLSTDIQLLIEAISRLERPASEYDLRSFDDLSLEEYESVVAAESLWIPSIPKLHHWFRKYVTIDLARMLRVIYEAKLVDERTRTLARLAFASTIRNVSNADPVPVSGLEVTSHMLKKEAEGRRINPIEHVKAALRKAAKAAASFADAVPASTYEPIVVRADATRLGAAVPTGFDAVITSPPYHNAVDYYRRHQLEMYWLKLVRNHEDRLELLPAYIGRHRIPAKNEIVQAPWEPGPVSSQWYEKMAHVSPQRATDLKHYLVSMGRVFVQLSERVKPDGPVVLVVGESSWRGEVVPTRELLAEVAYPYFTLHEHLWYPIKNRYMSYSRHNGADIGHEHVLVFR